MLQVCFQSMITDECAYKCFTFVGTMEGVSGVTKLSEYLCLLDDGMMTSFPTAPSLLILHLHQT